MAGGSYVANSVSKEVAGFQGAAALRPVGQAQWATSGVGVLAWRSMPAALRGFRRDRAAQVLILQLSRDVVLRFVFQAANPPSSGNATPVTNAAPGEQR